MVGVREGGAATSQPAPDLSGEATGTSAPEESGLRGSLSQRPGAAQRDRSGAASRASGVEESVAETTETSTLAAELGTIGMGGALAGAGYLLLNTRAGLWMLSVLTSRPLWKDFDVLEVVYSWEDKEETPERSDQDKETLLSMVDGAADQNGEGPSS